MKQMVALSVFCGGMVFLVFLIFCDFNDDRYIEIKNKSEEYWQVSSASYDRNFYQGQSSESDSYLAHSYEIHMVLPRQSDLDSLNAEMTDKVYRLGGHIENKMIIYDQKDKDTDSTTGRLNILIEIPAENSDVFVSYLYEAGEVICFNQNRKYKSSSDKDTGVLQNDVIYSDFWIYVEYS